MLAFYVVVEVFFFIVGWVSFNSIGMNSRRETPLIILSCIVGAIGLKKKNLKWRACKCPSAATYL